MELYSACTAFKENHKISYSFIKVTFSDTYREVYSNVHAIVIPTRMQIIGSGNRKGVFSVLLVGIDNISKLNLRRRMPETYKHLEKHYISLKGYNKIAENTFHNLMAILTGRNATHIDKHCGSYNSIKIELKNCGIIGDTFKSLAYVTGYIEDI
ncbi:hypothetical protein NQ314_013485 [Rhamnusium bicolor]|uniref:Uncharacterized protein n=1 Tax=Rhamnusium bicolor TaxID=1586634 RepID=A0AAV8X6R0_9CUCU|nr:hypothetical protein NQ314_013485 [Rhamnusium bicolor]